MKIVKTIPEEPSDSDLLVLMSDWQDIGAPLGNLEAPRPGYRMIEGVFDTGAFKSWTPSNPFPGKSRPSKISLEGKHFSGVDQSPIPNLGGQDCRFLAQDGTQARMCLQVADIDRVLIAGADMTVSGDTKVELLKDSGNITNVKMLKTIPLHRRGNVDGGVCVMRLWIPMASLAGSTRQATSKKQRTIHLHIGCSPSDPMTSTTITMIRRLVDLAMAGWRKWCTLPMTMTTGMWTKQWLPSLPAIPSPLRKPNG